MHKIKELLTVNRIAHGKKMGYNVLSGQHGLKVRIPIHTTWLKINNEEFVKLSEATAAQKEAYQKGMIEGFEKLSFGIGNVFDISQTDFPKTSILNYLIWDILQRSISISAEVSKTLQQNSFIVRCCNQI
mgnify:CR=1 FL=1